MILCLSPEVTLVKKFLLVTGLLVVTLTLLNGCAPSEVPPLERSKPEVIDPGTLMYYDTIEEAAIHNNFSGLTHVTDQSAIEVIKLFENDTKAALAFKANVDGKDAIYFYKFFVKTDQGKVKYSSPVMSTAMTWKAHSIYLKQAKLDAIEEIRLGINLYSSDQTFSIEDGICFVWGLSQSAEINNLKVEGQSLTQAIPVEMDGAQVYFWYFDNLATDKAIKDMLITL